MIILLTIHKGFVFGAIAVLFLTERFGFGKVRILQLILKIIFKLILSDYRLW